MSKLTARDVGKFVIRVENTMALVTGLCNCIAVAEPSLVIDREFEDKLLADLVEIANNLNTIAHDLANALPQTNLLEQEESDE